MIQTLDVRLSGDAGGTETVEGFAVGGLFVHHPVKNESRPQAYHDQWVISHMQSGMSLGCWFDKRSQAIECAREIGEHYDTNVTPTELLAQFKARAIDGKPSIVELAEKNGMRI